MKESTLKKLSDSVIEIYDSEGNKIPFKNFTLKEITNKGHKSKNTSIEVYIDGIKTAIRDKVIVYKCSCGEENKILLKKFIVKQRLKCRHCSNDEEKSYNHSLFWKLGYQPRVFEPQTNNVYSFDDESDEFKKDYFNKHLRKEEFKELSQHITSISGIRLENSESIEYFEHSPVKNQFKYYPYLNIDGKFVKFADIYMKCEVCGEEFRLSNTRSKRNILEKRVICCRHCAFANFSFPIISYKTVFGDNITYQGKLEKEFIEECEKNNIKILDGNRIEYLWNERKHIYTIDFFLPEYKYLIELKENHIWHRRQIENGKWGAKENAAKAFASENGNKYIILFSKDITNFINTLRDSLNNGESH